MPKPINKIIGGEISKSLISENASPFCNCNKQTLDLRLSSNELFSSCKSICTCGEEFDKKIWTWDVAEGSDVLLHDNALTFHPIYSQGTAVVKGAVPLEYGMQHYWEIKIMSYLTGTDMVSFFFLFDCFFFDKNLLNIFTDDWRWN